MNDYNFQNNNSYADIRKKRDVKILNALVYIIVIVTMVMVSPLIYKFADDYSNSRISSPGVNEIVNERSIRNRRYTVSENTVDISVLKNTEFGTLNLVTAKITDSGDIILLCSSREKKNSAENSTETKEEYEEIMRIAAVKPDSNGAVDIYTRAVRYNFLESLQNKDYTFKDYGDGTIFMSNNRAAFLFDIHKMNIAANYAYPANYHIYQTALSNNKDMLALATEEGFFVGNLISSNMNLNSSNIKELIATTITASGVKMSARYPVWSSGDDRIYYKLYADNNVRNAGVTATSPGGNEQLTSLDCTDFLFLKNDSIFYYFLSGNDANPGNLFKCGYFYVNEKKMTDVMKSQIYYFDINVSSDGSHLAALSHNGSMIKISIIDIPTKKLIYSSLYSDIYDFSFSPDEKKVIIYGKIENNKTLKVININWTEE